MAGFAIYIAYCVLVVSVSALLYVWYDKRSRGILVKHDDLKALRKFQKVEADYLAWTKIPLTEYPKSQARAIADRWDELEFQRDEARDEANGLQGFVDHASLRLAQLEAQLTTAKQSALVGWEIADGRYENLCEVQGVCNVLQKRLDERDEELDEARREIEQLRPEPDMASIPYHPAFMF